MLTEIKLSPIQLHYQERNRTIVVTPADENRFCLIIEEAIRACKAAGKTVHFQTQFQKLLNRLAQWINIHRSDIDKVYLTVRDIDILFLVERRTKLYSREFEDALTDLDIEIAQDREFNLIRMSVLALPKSSIETIDSFLEPNFTLQYSHAK